MFQEFPYTDMHQLNLDWIIKIAKDFLDQYTHIQQLITDGEQSLQDLTTDGLQQLQEKADNLEALLQAWYDTHSQDIADQLADALADLNEWYTTHQNYLDETLAIKTAAFNAAADEKAAETIASIPDDYTALSQEVDTIEEAVYKPSATFNPRWTQGSYTGTGGTNTNSNYIRSTNIIYTQGGLTLTPDTGYQVRISYFNADGSYIDRDPSWSTTEKTIPQNSYVGIVAAKTDLSDLLPSAGSHITITNIPYRFASVDEIIHTLYVDGQNGSDANTGKTLSNALKTITEAMARVSGPAVIEITRGVYNEILNITKSDIKILSAGFPTYSEGTPLALIEVEAVNISNCCNIELTGIKANPGNTVQSGFAISKVDGYILTDCESNGGISGGFVVTRSNGKLIRCIAHDVGDSTHQQSDGFNFHETGYSELVDCIAYNCSDDGVSHHDNTIGTIIGGEFYNCGMSDGGNTRGGGIAPAGSAIVNIYGAYVHDSFRGFEMTGTNNQTKIFNSVSLNNRAVDIYASAAVTRAYNVHYVSKRVTEGSSFVEL